MNYELCIDDYYELLSLHKALLEAKFNPDSVNKLISGSPHIANISERVVEILIKMDVEKDANKGLAWEKLLDIKNQPTNWEIAIRKACEFDNWDRFNSEKKKNHVKCLVSPFRCSDDDIDRFIDIVDEKRQGAGK